MGLKLRLFLYELFNQKEKPYRMSQHWYSDNNPDQEESVGFFLCPI